MKKLTTAIIMAASLSVAAGAIAKKPNREPPSEEMIAQMIAEQQTAVEQLELQPALEEQVKSLVAENAAKRAELRKSFFESEQALKTQYDEDLSKLLTEEQIDDLQEAMHENMREHFKGERDKFHGGHE